MKKNILIIGLLYICIVYNFSLTPANYTNIAQNKPVTASSNYASEYQAQNAVDGKNTTIWGSKTGSTPEWLYVDLVKPQNINGIGIYWFGKYYAKDYSIWVSHDRVTWTNVATITKKNGLPDVYKSDTSITCRYVGILCTTKNDIAYAIKEFEIYQNMITPTPTPIQGLRELADSKNISFGSAFYYRQGYDRKIYEEKFLANFNSLTPEHGIIFKVIKPTQTAWDFTIADEIIAFAQSNQLPVRGHHLIWHHNYDGGVLLPDWLLNGNYTKAEINEIMKEFIQTTMRHYKNEYPGTIQWWSVVNEIVSNGWPADYMPGFWYDNLGPEYIDNAFIWAREADPDAKLYYNDYYIEGITSMKHKADFAYSIVKGLVDRKVPIDGVGLQCHFTLDNYPGKAAIQEVLDKYFALGLEVYITELDIKIEGGVTEYTLEDQAKAFQEVLELCLENDLCTTFGIWGFNDAQTYMGESFAPTIMDKNYEPKPAWHALKDTLLAPLPQ